MNVNYSVSLSERLCLILSGVLWQSVLLIDKNNAVFTGYKWLLGQTERSAHTYPTQLEQRGTHWLAYLAAAPTG